MIIGMKQPEVFEKCPTDGSFSGAQKKAFWRMSYRWLVPRPGVTVETVVLMAMPFLLWQGQGLSPLAVCCKSNRIIFPYLLWGFEPESGSNPLGS